MSGRAWGAWPSRGRDSSLVDEGASVRLPGVEELFRPAGTALQKELLPPRLPSELSSARRMVDDFLTRARRP